MAEHNSVCAWNTRYRFESSVADQYRTSNGRIQDGAMIALHLGVALPDVHVKTDASYLANLPQTQPVS